jgi:hypothetical protein
MTCWRMLSLRNRDLSAPSPRDSCHDRGGRGASPGQGCGDHGSPVPDTPLSPFGWRMASRLGARTVTDGLASPQPDRFPSRASLAGSMIVGSAAAICLIARIVASAIVGHAVGSISAQSSLSRHTTASPTRMRGVGTRRPSHRHVSTPTSSMRQQRRIALLQSAPEASAHATENE